MEQEQAKASHSLNLNPAPRGFLGGSVVKNPPADTGDPEDAGLIPGSGRFPGKGNGYPLQYSCLENPRTQNPRSLVGYSPLGHRKSDTIK